MRQIAVKGSRASAKRTRARAVTRVSNATARSGSNCHFQRVVSERAGDGSNADDAHQHAIELGYLVRLAARDQRQQRAIGACEREERHRSNQCRVHISIVRGVTDAHAHGAAQTFGGQALGGLKWRSPPQQRGYDFNVAGPKNPEGHRNSKGCDNDLTERRAHGTAETVADAIGGDRAVQILAGHKKRSDSLPRRRAQRPPLPDIFAT